MMKKIVSVGGLFLIAVFIFLLKKSGDYQRIGKQVEYKDVVYNSDTVKVVRSATYKLNQVRYDTIDKRSKGNKNTLDVAPSKSTDYQKTKKYVRLQVIDLNDIFFEPSDPYIDWNHCCGDDYTDSVLRSQGIYYDNKLDCWVKQIK